MGYCFRKYIKRKYSVLFSSIYQQEIVNKQDTCLKFYGFAIFYMQSCLAKHMQMNVLLKKAKYQTVSYTFTALN